MTKLKSTRSAAFAVFWYLITCTPPVLGAPATPPLVGANVNMVTGTKWPAGDPLLNKQNEGSLAVSSVNPQHLLGGANDYRLVNPVTPVTGGEAGADAWIVLYKSVDGGATWRTSLMAGCPLNIPECNSQPSPVKGLQFAADPTVRPGPYGTFFLSFIVGNRDSSAGGVTAIQRFIDRNSNIRVDDDPFVADAINVIDTGTKGQFKDKPWNIADVPGRPWNGSTTCVIPGYNNSQAVPAFNVYISFTNFVGQSAGNPHPQILVARSRNCGQTFENPVKVSASVDTNSGSTVTIDPQTGAVYVVWRRFGDPAAGSPHALYMSSSTDGGNKWSTPTPVTDIIPFDQARTGATFRTNDLPSATTSVDSQGKSRLHVAWAQRKAAVNANANADARIALLTAPVRPNGSLGPWGPIAYVDDWTTDPANPANPGRGHQLQVALTFAAGRLAAVWLDQRHDHTVGRLVCAVAPCASILDYDEIRVPVGNYDPAVVFTPFVSDATPGLARRHTLDIFAAFATPDDLPQFRSNRVSRYLYGSRKAPPGTVSCPAPAPAEGCVIIEQQQQSPPNLPIAADGTLPFIGDYIDIATQTIVPTGTAAQPYAFNCGTVANACINTGTSPAFHPVWTDNRDVVRPRNGDWTNHTSVIQFANNADGSVTTVPNLICVAGQEGSRNSNLYTAVIGENAVAYANANAKLLNALSPRGFVVTVQNLAEPLALDQDYRSYYLNIVDTAPVGGRASFEQNVASPTALTVAVPPRSTATRTVWVTSGTPGARVRVDVSMLTDKITGAPITTPVAAYNPALHNLQQVSQVVLNPDPNATLVTNADGGLQPDLANNDLTDVALANVALSNAALTNVALTNVALANVALANVDLTNVDLANVALTNADLTNVALANAALTNYTLGNVAITNADLTNADLSNVALANVELTNADLTNNTFTNAALTNAALANYAPVDATFTITNAGNTDTTLAVKTLLRDIRIPGGMKVQLLLRKVSLSPSVSFSPSAVGSCKIGFLQQNAQVANWSTPKVEDGADPNLGQFPTGNATAATLPLSAGEKAQVTLRVLGAQCDPGNPAVDPDFCGRDGSRAFAQWGAKFVVVGAAGTITSIPLIIKTLKLTPVPALASTTLPLQSFGGFGAVQWELDSATTPPWVAINPNTGALTVTPPTKGIFTVLVKAKDQSQPQQFDRQQLTLTVLGAPQTITFATPLPPSIEFGQSLTLNASSTSGALVTFTASGACSVVDGNRLITIAVSPPLCTVVASQNGTLVYAETTITRTLSVTKASQLIDFGPLPARTYGDASFAVNASASSGLPVGFTATGNCTIAGNVVTLTGGGSCTVTASQSGGASYLPATPVAQTFSIGVAAQTITFAALADRQFGDPPFTVSATASSGLVVVFLAIGNCSASANAITLTGAGSCTVTAQQAGDANFAAADAVARTFAITAPATFTFTGSMSSARSYHTATLLADGLVLIVGGLDASGSPTASSEIYDPSSGAFTAAGNLPGKAAGHTATRLNDGRVLAVGGGNSSAVIFDAATRTWKAAGGTSSSRSYHTATLLRDGRVLLVGGSDGAGKAIISSSIYDPVAGSFATGPSLSAARERHTATLLADGRVLVAGGRVATGNRFTALRSAEIYDPATNAFTTVTTMLSARYSHGTSVVAGKVLVAGGNVGSTETSATEVFDPATGVWTALSNLVTARSEFTVTPLDVGRILIAGGQSGVTRLAVAEIYSASVFSAGASMQAARSAHSATTLPNGRVLIVGGVGASGSSINTAELYGTP